MNRDERTPEQRLDGAIDNIRDEKIDPEVLDQARRRSWERIARAVEEHAASPVRISSCSDFQALLPEYLAGTLIEGRRLLVEDHTHECVACRRALHKLSAPARVVTVPAARPSSAWRKYAIAASLLVTAGLAGWRAYDTFGPAPAGSRATVQAASGSVYRIANGVLQPVAAGEEIAETDVLRIASGGHLMLRLRDGSQVEAGERAEFGVSMSRSDTTLKLNRGTLIVQAAKRGSGHLYVTSADCRVAVTGTVFAVNRGMKGSRVSVVEGSVEVEHGGREVTLRPGDQVSTDSSMASVPIQQEIAWSRNFSEHLELLNAIASLKTKLETVRIPELRYGSRLMELVPADTVVFGSVPNVGQAISEAHKLFEEQLRLSPVLQQWSQGGGNPEKAQLAIDTVRRLSEYIGDEIVLAHALRRDSVPHIPVIVAEVQRAGFREFLTSELAKLSGENGRLPFQIIEGPLPAGGAGRNELLLVLRGKYVVVGDDVSSLDEVSRNIEGTGPKAFASSDFGRRLTDRLRAGTGVLFGFDLQRIAAIHPIADKGQQPQKGMLALGADRVRYLIAEQKQVGNDAQRSAELSFAGARSGIASWLGSPAPIGGLAYVSPDAQLVAAALMKRPEQLVDDFFALQPDAARIFEEARKHLGIDLKQDVASALGGEATFAIDGPLVPTVSWKVALDITDPVRLQKTIERIVYSANMVAQLSGRQGYTISSETRDEGAGIFAQSGPLTFHTVRVLDPSPVPEIHYVYTAGYLIVAPSRGLLTKALQSKQAGVTLSRSDRFRQLLPRDGHANVSAVVYQNAGQWLQTIASSLGSAEQRAAGEAAAKIGPILVCAYGEEDRIEIVNKGSAWDIVMQSVLQPALNLGTSRAARSYR
jgi:ferric-dicitrate binding protein FerR (iron transport regulator)